MAVSEEGCGNNFVYLQVRGGGDIASEVRCRGLNFS